MAKKRPLLYVAGPYAGSTPEAIAENVRRATEVAKLAALRGFAPIVPHLHGHAGVHGSPDESCGKSRGVALECAVAQVAACRYLFVILRDDGTLSPGTALEYDAWLEANSSRMSVLTCLTWFDWQQRIADPGRVMRPRLR